MTTTQILEVPDVVTQVETCRAKIQKLQERQAEPTKSRHIVQALNEQIGKHKRVLAVLDAGYAQITLPWPQGWRYGFVGPDPRPFKNPFILPSIAGLGTWILSALGTSLGVHLALQLPLLADIGIYVASVLIFFIVGFVGFCITASLVDTRNHDALRDAGFPTTDTVWILKVMPPLNVMTSYQRAMDSGLFEQIGVLAPREAFTKAETIDPIMYGEVAGKTFLIAWYNREDDLKDILA